jgi:hypothetical protein
MIFGVLEVRPAYCNVFMMELDSITAFIMRMLELVVLHLALRMK